MVGILIRMKLRVLRHSLRGNQAWLTAVGALVGLAAAVATVLLSTVDFERPGIGVDVLAAVYLLWTLGWLFGPVFTGGGDETLRPEHFALLPVTPTRLAGGLLGAAFVGVPAIVTAIAFCGLFGIAGGAATLVAVIAVPAQLVFVVLLSRVVMAGLGAVLRSRRGRDLGVLLAALVGLSGFGIQYLLNGVGPVLVEGRSPTLSTVLRAVPSGWGTVAVDAAARSAWPLALASLAGLLVLVGGLLVLWGALLLRRLTRPATDTGPARRRAGSGLGRRLPATPVGAVAAKELRTWGRDARRRVALLSMLLIGVVTSVVPALSGGGSGGVPFTGLAMVTFGCLLAGNLYGMDGNALWHTLVVPGAERVDVRGRQLAWFLIVGPVTLVLVAVLPGITNPGAYPWVLALAPALLGGGAGLIVVLSVFAGYPMPDQRSSNPFAAGGNPGLVRGLLQFAIALLLAVVALPVAAVVWLGGQAGSPVVQWLGVPVGIAIGVLLCWWWGRLAHRRLAARGPEILLLVGKQV